MTGMMLRRVGNSALLVLGGLTAGCATTGQNNLTDGNVVAVAMALNNGEIMTSQPAISKAANARVKTFAQLMIDHHTAANGQLAAVGIPAQENAMSQALTQTATELTASLSPLSGEQFDRAYMRAQIQLHETALRTLTNVLIPETESGALLNVLQQMRATVVSHLEMARDIDDDLN